MEFRCYFIGDYSDGQYYYRSFLDQNYNRKFYRTNQALTNIELIPSNVGQQNVKSKSYCKCGDMIYSFTTDNKMWKYNPSTLNTDLAYDFKENYIVGNPLCMNDKIIWLAFIAKDFNVSPAVFGTRLIAYNINSADITQFEDIYLHDPFNSPYHDMVLYKSNSLLYPKSDKRYGLELFKAGFCDEGNTNRQGLVSSGDYYYTINVQSSEVVELPKAVNLFSEKSILLTPGFEAKNGAVFYSTVKDCK